MPSTEPLRVGDLIQVGPYGCHQTLCCESIRGFTGRYVGHWAAVFDGFMGGHNLHGLLQSTATNGWNILPEHMELIEHWTPAVGDRVRVPPGHHDGRNCSEVYGRVGIVVFIDGEVRVDFTFEEGVGGWWLNAGCLEPVYGVVDTTTTTTISSEPNHTLYTDDDDQEDMVECSYCGEDIPEDTTTDVDGEPWCQRCVDIHTFYCDECNSTRPEGDSDECDSCGHRMCSDCLEEHDCEPPEHERIHSYSYDPHPFIFHGDGPRYFGVELEIDKGGQDDYNASRLLDDWSDDEQLFYVKEDGSIDSGFEIVTHPASLDFHRTVFPWAQITKLAVEMGYSSHDTTTCGLHVHVSRDGTGATRQAQDIALSKLIFLFWRHWVPLTKFSRRHLAQLIQWADINYKDLDAHLDKIEPGAESESLVQAKRYRGKYAAINTEHARTLEIRIFRGTLRPETILASIELVDLLVDLSMQWSFEQVVGSTWEQVVEQVGPNRPELSLYLASRRMVMAGGSEK